jgi:hypothetical protein
MLYNSILFVCIACFLTSTKVAGARTPPQYKPQNWVSIWAGTPVVLELAQSLEVGKLSIGTVVRFKVHEDVSVNGKVAIKSGATAYGRVRQIEFCVDANDCQAIALVAETVTAIDGQNINLSSVEQDFKISTRPQKKVIYPQTPLNATVLNTQKISF